MRIAGLGISQVPRLLLGLGNGGGRSGGSIDPHQAREFCRAWSGGGLTLLALCLAVYLPGLWSIPPVDRDESRFAQASRQMYESADFIVPHTQDRPRLNKPPLIYWLQCASIAAFGDREGQYANANIWVFRVPSVLAAIASVLLTWRMGMRMFDPRAALMGAALLAVAPMVIWDAHQARADQVLMATVVAAQWSLFEVWRTASREPRAQARGLAKRWAWPMAFWIAISLGILTKGPIAPMIAALTVLLLGITTRSWRWILSLQPAIGVLIIGATVGPWVYAVIQRVGWPTYWSTIYQETIGRSAEAKEGHWGPPGYHTVLLCVLFWPGVLMAAAGVIRAWRRAFGNASTNPERQRGASVSWRRFRSAAGRKPELFLLAWILPSWIVFELIATKLPHYTMPMYPAIALVSARALLWKGGGAGGSVDRIGAAVWLAGGVGWGLAGAGLGVLVMGLATNSHGPRISTVSAIGANVAIVVSALMVPSIISNMRKGRVVAAVTRGALMVAALASVSLAWLVPELGLTPGADTGALADEISRRQRSSPSPLVIATTYHEDSMIFWTRGAARRIEGSEVAAWFDANSDGICVVELPISRDLQGRGLLAGETVLSHRGRKFVVATKVGKP